MTDNSLITATRQLIYQYLDYYGCLPRPRRALLVRGLVTWQAMGVRHILEGNIGSLAVCGQALS